MPAVHFVKSTIINRAETKTTPYLSTVMQGQLLTTPSSCTDCVHIGGEPRLIYSVQVVGSPPHVAVCSFRSVKVAGSHGLETLGTSGGKPKTCKAKKNGRKELPAIAPHQPRKPAPLQDRLRYQCWSVHSNARIQATVDTPCPKGVNSTATTKNGTAAGLQHKATKQFYFYFPHT